MSFTILDGFVILVILISAYLASVRGLTREAMSIGGWIIAGLAAFTLAPTIQPMMVEIPGVGGFLKSCTLSTIAAYVIVFGAALILVSLFTPLLSSAIRESALSSIDRGLGFIFGVTRGLLLVAVVYILYDSLTPKPERMEMVAQSQTFGMVSKVAGVVSEELPTEMPDWLSMRIDQLMGRCSGDVTPGAEIPTQTS